MKDRLDSPCRMCIIHMASISGAAEEATVANTAIPARDPNAILLIDPDRPWAEAVCGALKEMGLAPAHASTTEEALWRLHERRYGLLIISSMSGDGAVETLLREINAHGAPPPVLLVEDRRGGGISEAWRFLRAARTLRRPCRVKDVADAAKSLARGTGTGRNAMA